MVKDDFNDLSADEQKWIKIKNGDGIIEITESEYKELVREANRKKVTVSAYIRSSTLMRIAGDLIEKQVAEDEYVRRNINMKTLDERGTF